MRDCMRQSPCSDGGATPSGCPVSTDGKRPSAPSRTRGQRGDEVEALFSLPCWTWSAGPTLPSPHTLPPRSALAVSPDAVVGYLGRTMSPTASHTGRRADDRRGAPPRRGTEIKRPAQDYERELRRHELAIGRSLTSVLPSDRPARMRELVEARRVM